MSVVAQRWPSLWPSRLMAEKALATRSPSLDGLRSSPELPPEVTLSTPGNVLEGDAWLRPLPLPLLRDLPASTGLLLPEESEVNAGEVSTPLLSRLGILCSRKSDFSGLL